MILLRNYTSHGSHNENIGKRMKAITDEEGIKNLKMIANEFSIAYTENHKEFKENLYNKIVSDIKNNVT